MNQNDIKGFKLFPSSHLCTVMQTLVGLVLFFEVAKLSSAKGMVRFPSPWSNREFRGEGFIRLTGGLNPSEGNVEILHNGVWGNLCDDDWDSREAKVACYQLGYFHSVAIPTHGSRFGQSKNFFWMDDLHCSGEEKRLFQCRFNGWGRHDCAKTEAAGVICSTNHSKPIIEDVRIDETPIPDVGHKIVISEITKGETPFTKDKQTAKDKYPPGPLIMAPSAPNLPDLVIDFKEIEKSAFIENRPMYYLQCAMEENCLSKSAYELKTHLPQSWHLENRRLLRFTAKTTNVGTVPFRPYNPKHLWEFHLCHMHYHSMEVFATFDIYSGTHKVAEGHKASFCLEDNQCSPHATPQFSCANFGDQGISPNCSDVYRYDIDCQWVDVTDLHPGRYTFKVAVNPELKVPESCYENNAARCELHLGETFARIFNCVHEEP